MLEIYQEFLATQLLPKVPWGQLFEWATTEAVNFLSVLVDISSDGLHKARSLTASMSVHIFLQSSRPRQDGTLPDVTVLQTQGTPNRAHVLHVPAIASAAWATNPGLRPSTIPAQVFLSQAALSPPVHLWTTVINCFSRTSLPPALFPQLVL